MILPVLVVSVALYLFFQTNAGGIVTGYDSLYKKYASIYDLDWKMLKAICIIESHEGRAPSVAWGLVNPSDIEKSKSTDGKSWGIMQVTLPTARDYDSSATAEKLNVPEYSMNIAAQHLAYLKRLFSNQIEWIVKSYNQGQGNSLKEKRGEIKGYASGYWLKYMNAYSSIEGI